MRKIIGIIIPLDSIDLDYIINETTSISDITKFNQKHAHVVGIRHSIERWAIEVYLTHSEFPKVPSGCMCESYFLPEAKKIFPYLFVDTNPILYRKFNR